MHLARARARDWASWTWLAAMLLAGRAHAEGLPVTEAARAYWRECAASIGETPDRRIRARRIGSTPETADLLLALILAGQKTMTTTSPWLYDDDLQAAPEVGDTWVVVDGRGQPAAVVRTASVKVLPMDLVTQPDTLREGPAARQLDTWRKVHGDYLARMLAPQHRTATDDMPVTLEYFGVLCPRTAAAQ